MDRHELEKYNILCRSIIDKKDLEFDVHSEVFEMFCNELILQMRTYVYAEKTAKDEKIIYPKNWIESLKERFAPKWFLNKYPVKYTVHIIKHMIHYPDLLKFKSPQWSKTVKFIVHNSSEWSKND